MYHDFVRLALKYKYEINKKEKSHFTMDAQI